MVVAVAVGVRSARDALVEIAKYDLISGQSLFAGIHS